MYEFQSRLPLDHALQLIKNVRQGDLFLNGDNLILVGAINGELGALIKSLGFPVTTQCELTFEECCQSIESLVVTTTADPAFDITPFIPVFLKLIEWLISRRG